MPSAKRTEKITCRLRARERDLIEAAARHRGVHLSELVREASVREARKVFAREDGGEKPEHGHE